VFFQGHASPGIYARAYLEGRLTQEQLDGFRQESRPASLPSYPHPRLMPDFWEFPTVSMGLGPIGAIYQARFNRYLHHRGIKDTSAARVWCFLGDGEMDEPESLGAIGVAAREELDNLVFVVNCNLQRLDGRSAATARSSRSWSRTSAAPAGTSSRSCGAGSGTTSSPGRRRPAAQRDEHHARRPVPDLLGRERRLHPAELLRPRPPLLQMVEHLSDDEIRGLPRGGHDYRKVYAAFDSATKHVGQPTVILAHTIKGWTLGKDFEGRNATHQMKKLTKPELKELRDRLLPRDPDSALEGELPPYFHPGEDSDEVQYMKERALARRLAAPAASCAPRRSSSRRPRPTTSSRRARASRRSPPRWPSSGCSRTS
jgi:pyruvate dehydrogenase E1 component